MWPSLQAISERWEIDATFEPGSDRLFADLAYAEWTAGRRTITRAGSPHREPTVQVVVGGSLAAVLFATAAAARGEIDERGRRRRLGDDGAPSVQWCPRCHLRFPGCCGSATHRWRALKFYSPSQRAIAGMTYVLDAESCRRLVRPSCHSLAGNVPNTALEAIQGADGAFDAVVVGTGYNEGSSQFSSDFDHIVAAARSKRRGAHPLDELPLARRTDPSRH